MIIKPIIPIWIMTIICVLMIILKRKRLFAFIRQLIMIALLFVINLRIMVPDNEQVVKNASMDVKIVFVLDDTLSMVADDYNGKTTRMEGAKNDCIRIMSKFQGAKFSVVSFHNTASISSPMTNNTEHITSIIDSIVPIRAIGAKGTSFDSCKTLLDSYLEKQRKKDESKILLYFLSDGELTNEATLPDFSSISKYIDGGAVLGYGTKEGSTMYAKKSSPIMDEEEYDYVKDNKTYEAAISKMDEANLQTIAKEVGIQYKNMNNMPDIDDVTDSFVEDLKVKEDEKDSSIGYKDTYYFVILFLLVLLIYDFYIFRKERISL